MPSSLIEDQDGVRARCNVEGDFGQVHSHGFAIAAWHNDPGGLALGGADGPEDVGRGRALIFGC